MDNQLTVYESSLFHALVVKKLYLIHVSKVILEIHVDDMLQIELII